MKPFAWHREELAKLVGERSRMPHALLVHGPRGIGKLEFARALAAALLCEDARGTFACGECASCHWFSQGNHPDYREVMPEASVEAEAGISSSDNAEPAQDERSRPEGKKSLFIKVDQIRAQADFMALTTHRAGFRVLVIHRAEDLHPAAANALLKTLEEPPPATLIVLVSDRPAHVLPTIRSRCRAVPLALPDRQEALQWLRAEGVAEAEVALACAGGSPLFAREIATPEEAQLRMRVVAELARPKGADAVAFGEKIDAHTLERTVHWMQAWVHDLVRLRAGVGVRHHVDSTAAAAAKARAADLEALFDLELSLRASRRLLSHPLNARLVAEHLLIAYNRATTGSNA